MQDQESGKFSHMRMWNHQMFGIFDWKIMIIQLFT